jgi:hypothetical protein
MANFHIRFLEALIRDYSLSTNPRLLILQLMLLAAYFRHLGDDIRFQSVEEIIHYLRRHLRVPIARPLRQSVPLQLEVVFCFTLV